MVGWGAPAEYPDETGFVAVAGRPNVGKSTLVNALVGEKVAIVSAVPHTTRRRIFGVANGDDWQLVLVDLPGFQRPIDALTQRMQRTVDSSFDDIDLVLLVVDCRGRIGAGDHFVARRVFALGKPVLIALNKIDRLKPAHVVSQMKSAATLGDFHALHPVSAKTKDGVGELRDDLVSLLPEGQSFFPREVATDQSTTERIEEIVREKALHLTREEVLHALTVLLDELEEGRVRAFILVETESAEGDPRRQEGRDGPRDRHARPPGDRGAARPEGLPRARRQGAPEVAPRRADARAPRPLMATRAAPTLPDRSPARHALVARPGRRLPEPRLVRRRAHCASSTARPSCARGWSASRSASSAASSKGCSTRPARRSRAFVGADPADLGFVQNATTGSTPYCARSTSARETSS